MSIVTPPTPLLPPHASLRDAHSDRSAWKERLRGVIVLAGGVRRNDFLAALGGPLLGLPLLPTGTLLTHWREHTAGLAHATGLPSIALRLRLSREDTEPELIPGTDTVRISIEKDDAEFRGTGGLLRDLCKDYEPDDAILICNANQVLLRPLAKMFEELSAVHADVVVLCESDGSPTGTYLLRAGSLAGVRTVGYLDFKEQVLPALASAHNVRVVRSEASTAMHVRTLEQYVRALRALTIPGGIVPEADPFAEEWTKTFAVVQGSASVHPTALIHDSVVMAGAKVGAGAVVVRSLVCPNAIIAPQTVVFDGVVPGAMLGANRRKGARA